MSNQTINVGRMSKIKNAYMSMVGGVHHFGRVVRAPLSGAAPYYVVELHRPSPGTDATQPPGPAEFQPARWPATNAIITVRFRRDEIDPIDDAALAAETEAMPAQE